MSHLELRRTDRYLVHDVIATGGMASVHIGIHHGALGFSRVVAVKRLHPQLASDARFVAMLIDEARLVSRIRHVNVVPTLDVLIDEGEVFVIMEYVRGASLARLIDRAREGDQLVPLPYAMSILSGVLRGLDAAHDAAHTDGSPLGIVHRDVSPQNVLVGVGGVPRLIDFGVARALGRSDPTRSGEFKGKLAYAAPEQLGDGTATRQTDVYALGVILWELLTGQRLFKAETDIGTFRLASRGHIPVPLDVRSKDARMRAQRTVAETEALTPIVMRALERDPKRRFTSAGEMAQALETLPAAPLPEIGHWVKALAHAELEADARIVKRAEERADAEAGEVDPDTIPHEPRADSPRAHRGEQLRGRTTHFLIGLPPATFVALALSAAAGAGLGAAFFGACAPPVPRHQSAATAPTEAADTTPAPREPNP